MRTASGRDGIQYSHISSGIISLTCDSTEATSSDGEPYLMDAQGKPHPIVEGQIIYRGGNAYRFTDGKFVKLSPDEIKQLQQTKKEPEQPRAAQQIQRNNATAPVSGSIAAGGDDAFAEAVESAMESVS